MQKSQFILQPGRILRSLGPAALAMLSACGGGGDAMGPTPPAGAAQLPRPASISVVLDDASLFGCFTGIAIDGSGTVYVANPARHTISKVAPSGQVSLLAGSPDHAGQTDGSGLAASFVAPDALALDAGGNLLVADSLAIRKVTPAGVVTAAVAPPPGSEEASGITVPMYQLVGVAVTPGGDIFDTYTFGTRKTTAAGVTTTIDGVPIPPQVTWPTNTPYMTARGIASDKSGNVYFADQKGGAIDKVAPDGKISVFAGTPGVFGNADGNGSSASFGLTISGLATDAAGNVYAADADNLRVRKITPAGVVTTLAGSGAAVQRPGGAVSWPMSPLPPGALAWPMTTLGAIAVDGNGYVYVTSGTSLLKIGPVQ